MVKSKTHIYPVFKTREMGVLMPQGKTFRRKGLKRARDIVNRHFDWDWYREWRMQPFEPGFHRVRRMKWNERLGKV